jgi:superfamily II DNA or RNA helicase
MKAILCETGIAFSATEYTQVYGNELLLKLQRKYTIRTVDRTTKIPQVTKLYTMIKCKDFKVIELPRFAMRSLVCRDKNSPSAFSPITELEIQLPVHPTLPHIEYIGKSNPNQQVVVNHVVEHFKNSHVNGMTLKLAAGSGKSFCAKDIINRLKLKTLIVVPNTYLLDQWTTLLAQYFPTTTIGTLYGKQKKDGDIIVGIINTVSDLQSFVVSEKKPLPNIGKTVKYIKVEHTIDVNELFKTIGLTIFDESQMYVSKEFRKVFRRISSRYTIGLSATPDIREDKLDLIHRAWVGPIVDADTLEGFNPRQDSFTAEANLILYHAENDNCKFNIREDGMIDYASIVEAIVNDPFRNNLIVEEIVKLMDKGLYTFVFSDRRSHLEHLYNLLEAKLQTLQQEAILELPEANKKVILYGGSDEQTIAKAKTIGTVVFTTYAYSSTGVSITKMNGLVLTTPRRSNMKQIIGRVFRLGSDSTIKRIIVDIVDAKLPLKSQVRERIKAYEERGCEIIKTKVQA